MYRPIYEGIDILADKDKTFISWICPLLNERHLNPEETLQYEGGKINAIHFIKEGSCAYVLRAYAQTPFMKLAERTHFGIIDIIAACIKKDPTGRYTAKNAVSL